ncbi:hypothetical protein [Virgisporangium aliadipatigenens]|nr:hypothetical protein [Virgisporangium aliadipatigenens]
MWRLRGSVVQVSASEPPMMPSSIPMKNPPRFEVIHEASDSSSNRLP